MENRTGMVSNLRRFHLARRVANYAASAILASLIYIIWVAVSITFGGGETTHSGLLFGFGFASVFLFVGGFVLALLLMIVPWAIAVWAQLNPRWDGRIYFPGVGALLVLTLGSTAAAISPKPFWIDDQTFLEGAVIAAQRQRAVSAIFRHCIWGLLLVARTTDSSDIVMSPDCDES
jgi:hypothetical protein